MPDVVSDIVDVYVFRRLNARVQFLLLQRRADVALGQTWQSFHTQIQQTETTIDAARRAVLELSGLRVSAVYSADYVNQFFDDARDVLVLAPVIAVNVSPQAPVQLGDELRDCAWLDRDEATARLPFTGQRWAVRHIDEIMSIGDAESELYRLHEPPATGNAPGPDSTAVAASPRVDPAVMPEPVSETERIGHEAGVGSEMNVAPPDEAIETSDAEQDQQAESRSYVPVDDE